MKTISYYNENAPSFYDKTINADLSGVYKRFLKRLPKKAHILDAGCGVGRDVKYFLKKGYNVTAFDFSQEMVNLAQKETGISILHLSFQEMRFQEEFNGVWASASLLHVPYEETREIYQRIYNALKSKGILYASYKYGQGYMPTAERDFWNMDEYKILPYLEGLFEIVDLEIGKDMRKNSPTPGQMWLNFIAQKK